MRKRVEKGATQRILMAAGQTIARYGYTQATFAKIAKHAGVSHGLLHYHFSTKEQLFARVLDINLDGSTEKMRVVLANAKSARGLARKMAQTFSNTYATDPTYFALFSEAFSTARQSKVVRKSLSRTYREFREVVIEGLEVMAERGTISPALPLETIATLFLSVLDGTSFALSTLTQEEIGEQIWDRLEQGLTALLAPPPRKWRTKRSS